MAWTAGVIETATAMWAEGASASEIARALGRDFTRNSVISKVHRLKLAKRSNATLAAAVAAGSRMPVKRPDRTRRQKLDDARIITTMRRRQETPPMPAEQMFADEVPEGVDVTGLVGIMQLGTHTCRWPSGDPLTPSFGFCAQQVATKSDGSPASPYCQAHHDRAYQHR